MYFPPVRLRHTFNVPMRKGDGAFLRKRSEFRCSCARNAALSSSHSDPSCIYNRLRGFPARCNRHGRQLVDAVRSKPDTPALGGEAREPEEVADGHDRIGLAVGQLQCHPLAGIPSALLLEVGLW